MGSVESEGVKFVKAAACGNDFLIVEANDAPAELKSTTRKLCDRHLGVGADGVEWLIPAAGPEADIEARLVNADGSDAEISGNGTRCVAAYWLDERGGEQVRIRTGAGVKLCTTVASPKKGEYVFSMGMGMPAVHGEQSVTAGKDHITGISLSLGNPQFVVFVENFEFDWRSAGLKVQRSGLFPQGVNVDFVRVRTDVLIEARFFERGVGETMSSGTGSCAAAVAAIHSGRCRDEVEVRSLGGPQKVRWEPGHEVLLEGPAKLICLGTFFV